MSVYLSGIGLCAPGLPDWPTGRAVLAGRQPYRPDESLCFDRVRLPRNEARRASLTVRLALQAATEALDQAGMDGRSCRAVFACSGGNTEALDALCRGLIEPGRPISPNQFNNSVYNAPLGYWTIATGSQQPASNVGAYDASFSAGLLEAVALTQMENRPVLLVAFDTPPPLALQPFRAVSTPFSMALLLETQSLTGHQARLQSWQIRSGAAESMLDSAMERLRLSNPAARGLPLLRSVAIGRTCLTLPYLPHDRLEFQVEPC
ncbi:MAG: beta-ketoacyl synthase chain length factor [Gammaproteobacteria bacterium]|nr:beta-ketoacyl synthase chain length factor [Gammaproteobacteria bacterium]MCP5198355.1 beta-ketoacyl synthase chain length factor [Gammaproteobacteria bacterium]